MLKTFKPKRYYNIFGISEIPGNVFFYIFYS